MRDTSQLTNCLTRVARTKGTRLDSQVPSNWYLHVHRRRLEETLLKVNCPSPIIRWFCIGVPSLTLKVAGVWTYGNPQLHSPKESEIAQRTYASHTRFAKYIIREDVVDLTDALEKFQFVLDQCLIKNPQRAAALTNLTWARLQGCPTITASICETAQLYYELLSLCPEGTHLQNIATGDNGVGYVICECNNPPIDPPNDGIHLRRIVLMLCQLGHQYPLGALTKLAEG
ncbi:hypothetical protein BDR07DRAFT_1463317 [Suillus spraguei]|nr:hypothetical protein BDR07DRAFT_1463317 [Suillus spraguei]